MNGFEEALQPKRTSELEDVRAAIYVRTSSTSQRFGHSIDEQVRQCLQRCQHRNWDVVYVFRDEAESGKDGDRPMFQEMMHKARSGCFTVVVFWKLDRFSRSLLHAVQLEAELRDENVALHSVTEQIDTTTSAGRFNFRNIASAAEFERDMIRDRSQMGMKGLALNGQWPNDQPPLGYQRAEDGTLEIDESEADLVREIFERYIEVKSMPQVADKLNQREITTKKGGEWTPRAIGDILGNELYVGTYEAADVSNHYEQYRIVDDELFTRANETRRRFRSDDQSRQKPMPEDQKRTAVDKMESMYSDFLDETV
jgi:site-specific DNA recombinase